MIKCLLFALLFTLFGTFCFGQKSLISYDDIKYLLHNDLGHADTFLMAKGYILVKKDLKNKNRSYALTLRGGTHNNIGVRSNGKRLFIEIETNEVGQYNMIRESIAQYINKDAMVADVQSFTVKDLGNIYITINDTVPYDPLRKDYDIQIVSDKHITAYQ